MSVEKPAMVPVCPRHSPTLAGALADRGMTRLTTLVVHVLLVLCFLGADAVVAAGSVVAFVGTALLSMPRFSWIKSPARKSSSTFRKKPGAESTRFYLTSMFVIGASGSLIGSAGFEAGGWLLTVEIGAAISAVSLGVFLVCDRPVMNG